MYIYPDKPIQWKLIQKLQFTVVIRSPSSDIQLSKMSVCGESESVLGPTSGQHFGLYANFKYFDRMVLGLVYHVEP